MRAVEDVPVTLNVNVVPLSHIISGFDFSASPLDGVFDSTTAAGHVRLVMLLKIMP